MIVVVERLRNNSWKPYCVVSFNMGWRILVFYPEWFWLKGQFFASTLIIFFFLFFYPNVCVCGEVGVAKHSKCPSSSSREGEELGGVSQVD
jgi:hypothetical protein